MFGSLGSAKQSEGRVTVSGVTVETDRTGIRFGDLKPAGNAVPLSPEARKVVGSPAVRLKLDALNQTYNHFKNSPLNYAGKPLVGLFKQPGQIFEGKAFIPVRKIVASALEQSGPSGAPIKPLVAALSEQTVLVTPAHQFLLEDGGVGNRIVAYSSEGSGIQHNHIDTLVHDLKKQGLRVIKLMTYFKYYKDKGDAISPPTNAQGGTLKEILADSVGGSWHAGGFSAGFDEDGRPVTSKSDWPTDYGKLTEPRYVEYNAHLFAIDYQGGVRQPIPPAMLAAYYRNAELWDCCAALTVPFVDKDKDPIYREYYYNPLEAYDRRSAQRVAANMVKLDTEQFLKKHGAFYCSEGQFTISNLGPQDYSLLKRSTYGKSPFGRLIDTFNAAPRYQGKSIEERRKLPAIGWDYLKELSPAKGGISEQQFEHLGDTDRLAIFLEFIPEDVRGWQAFGLREKEGLIARPMTVATLAWSLLRRYAPREGIARVVSEDIMRAYRTGNAQVKQAVVALCGGAKPDTPEGQVALAHVSVRLATGTLLGVLGSEETRKLILAKGGFLEVVTSWDKDKVQRAYDVFLDILRNADYNSQEGLDRALLLADEKLSSLTVWRRYYNKATKRQYPWRQALMKYAAPVCFAAWAQQPFLARTNCVRYVATAMHTRQAKTSG